MTYILRWHSASDGSVTDVETFPTRREADAALIRQCRAAAESMEHGTGTAATWSPDGRMWHDDHVERYLGQYQVEKIDR